MTDFKDTDCRVARASKGTVLTVVLLVGVLAGPACTESGVPIENEEQVENQDSVHAWFDRSSALKALNDYARFETNVLTRAIDDQYIETVSQIPVELTRGRLKEQYFGISTVDLASNLDRTGLEYSGAKVDIEVTTISNEPPHTISAASSRASWSPVGDDQHVYVKFQRVVSMQVDLNGATNIQGFDPAEGITTVSSDEFLAVFLNDANGLTELLDIAWLVSQDKPLTEADRPIGWPGTEALLVNRSPDLQRSSRSNMHGAHVTPEARDSVDEILASAKFPVAGVSPQSRQANKLSIAQKQNVVDYARRHAINNNQDFKTFGNDCTNFISQALQAGGWQSVSRGGVRTTVQKDPNLWFYRHMTWIYPESAEWASYTWTGVDEWFDFARNVSERTSSRGNIWRYEPGDILQVNIDARDDIDHSMVVTGKFVDIYGNTQILLSYHTNNRLDMSIRRLLDEWPGAWWYGHQT